jgi:trk system potassium uptake protein TrkH
MREKAYLKQRYAAILSAVGTILTLCAAVMLTPLSMAVAYPDEAIHAAAFALPALVLAAAGLSLRLGLGPPASAGLSIQEGGIIVLLSWGIVMLFSAWPFWWILDLPFSRALFESVSGWTTTGLSVVDVESAGPSILLWRSVMQLAGGAGLAILMMSAIAGPTGIGISSAEGRENQLVPQVRRSARLVLFLYAIYAAGGTLAYWAAGMSVFDAVNHAFAAVSTGGFSTRAESIGYWDSPAVEAATLPLMLLGNLNFVTAWFLFRGKFRAVFRNAEVRFAAVLLPLTATALFLSTSQWLYPRLGKSLRVAVFEATTALTTTGFSTVGYGDWNSFAILWMIGLMLIGGGICSTAGGIKQYRIFLLGKMIAWEIHRTIRPRSAVLAPALWEGGRRLFVDDAKVRQVAIFIFLYLLTFFAGVLLMCACGFPLKVALFEFASAQGTVGLSLGATGAGMPDSALWAMIVAMFLGRLEFIVVVAGLVKLGKDARGLLPRQSGKQGPMTQISSKKSRHFQSDRTRS